MSNPFKPKLTESLLLREYMDWLRKYGINKNGLDLRFGQHLCNSYLREGEEAPDLFYEEIPGTAFSIALNYIVED
jgi:hypothetical protein